MKKLAIILLAAASVVRANLVDLTPGGFDLNGFPITLEPTLDFGSSLSPIFNLGPYYNDNGLGGTYFFSNLFETSPTSSATISWNLTGQPDGDWLTYIILVGVAADGSSFGNIYGVTPNSRFQIDPQIVTVNGDATIYAIGFFGRNPAFLMPDIGSTFLLFFIALVVLSVGRAYASSH